MFYSTRNASVLKRLIKFFTVTLLLSQGLALIQCLPGTALLSNLQPLPCLAQNPETPLLPERLRWGIIDEAGSYTIEPKFEENLRIGEGMVLATPYSNANKYFERLKLFLYDAHGNQILKEALNEPDSYHSGLMSVKNGELYGYLDKRGKLALPYRYTSGLEFHGDYAINFLGDHFEIMDKTGKTAWKPSDGKIKINNKYGLGVITAGNQAVVAKIVEGKAPEFAGWFEQDLIPFQCNLPIIGLSSPLYGYLDKNGSATIKPIYTMANNFADGLAYVMLGNRHLLIDTSGEIKFEFDQVKAYSGQVRGGLVIVSTKPTVKGLHPTLCKFLPNKMGAVDTQNLLAIPADYDYISCGGNSNLILASKQTKDGLKYGFLDSKGAIKIPFVFDCARDFVDGYAAVAISAKQPPTQQNSNHQNELIAIPPNDHHTDQSSSQSTEQKFEQPIDQPTSELTVDQAKELDQSIRTQVRTALAKITIVEPLRMNVNLHDNGAMNVTILKGKLSPLIKSELSSRLNSQTAFKLPAMLKGVAFNLEYIALANGTIIGAEEPGDPFAQLREKLKNTEREQRYTYYSKSIAEHIKYLEDKADLEFSLNNGRAAGSNTFNELVRLYCATGAIDKAEAIAKQVDAADPENGFDLLMTIYANTKNHPKLLELFKRQYAQTLANQNKIDSYDPLIDIGNIYYQQGKMSLADDFYKKAANTSDDQFYTSDAFAPPAKQVPLDAMYLYACFLADRGRLAESAKLIRQCISILQDPANGISPRMREGRFDNFATYLAIIKDKDSALFKEIKTAKERRYPSEAIYGLLDTTGKEITAPEFAKLLPFTEGLAAAQDPLSHRLGYIDKNGHWVISASYYAATPFYNGKAAASMSKGLLPLVQYGYGMPYSIIDKSGKALTTTDFDTMYLLPRGLRWAANHQLNHKVSIIDLDGKSYYTGRFSGDSSFPLDPTGNAFTIFAPVGVEHSGCTVQEIGAPIRFEIKFDILEANSDTSIAMAQVSNTNRGSSKSATLSCRLSQVFPTPYRTEDQNPGRFGYKDPTGAVIIPPAFLKASVFCNGLAAVQSEITGRYFYIDTSGKTALETEYDDAGDFENAVAIVRRDGHAYLIDLTGKRLSPLCHGISPLSHDYYLVTDDENHAGIMSRDGKVIIEPKYRSIRQFSEGLAAFCKDDKWGFVNKQGVEVIPAKYAEVGDFSLGMTYYRRK